MNKKMKNKEQGTGNEELERKDFHSLFFIFHFCRSPGIRGLTPLARLQ
jgi:hypothetical protein